MTKKTTTTAKILILDIETAPAIVYSWGLFKQNIGINQIIKDGYVLMWCAKWLGEKKIMSDTLVAHATNHVKGYVNDDLEKLEHHIAKSVWKLADEADIIVTQNGEQFDLLWLNTMFLKHHLPPVSTYKSVDTCREAKKTQRFISNKLDFMARKLDLGKKIDTGGFELWTECMEGNLRSWKKMETYCKNDVKILEKVYLALRPFMKLHPNLGTFANDSELHCPNCGSLRIKKKGWFYTAVSKFQRYICLDCGKNIRDTHRESGSRGVGV